MRPLDYAARRGYEGIAIDLLLGDDETIRNRMKHRDANGATILHHAAAGNCSELFQYLVKEGVMNISLTCRKNYTAAHYAGM